MKKQTLLFVILTCLITNANAQLSESFEGTFPPANWYNSANWGLSSTQAYEGSNSARCIYTATNDSLITPTLDLSSGSYNLSFYWKELSLNNTDSVAVFLSTDNGQIWYKLDETGGGSDNIWTEKNIFISNPASSTCKIMWNYLKTGNQLTSFYLDKVEISIATTIKDIKSTSIEVFPNPINNNLITINNLSGEKTTIQIVNVLGKTIYKSEIIDSRPKISIPFDFESGIYFINIETPSKQFSKKLIQL